MTSTDSVHRKLLLIGLDAGEPRLIERWSKAGLLPNLRKLMLRGSYGRLRSSANWLAGSPWPTFYTGTDPSTHGLYHAMQWRSEKMAAARPAPDWLSLTPFWRALPDPERRVVALDMPMTYAPGDVIGKARCTEICGWATHDLLAPAASQPPELLAWAQGTVGPRIISHEVYGPQKVHDLLRLRDELIAATAQLSDLGLAMMTEFSWDLFAVSFGALHRGGHKLWDLTGSRNHADAAESEAFLGALQALYIACDKAIGALVERLDPETAILIFSLHGMGPNTSRIEILPEMLRRILAGGNAEKEDHHPSPGLLKRLRAAVPIELRSAVKDRLPQNLQDRLTAFWRLGSTHWNKTEAFPAIADLQGYIRINLAGREAEGIVEPGEAYDALCRKIEEGLRTFVDADTGETLVCDVMRSDALYADGSRLERLPDILVRWTPSAAASHRAIRSDLFGEIAWPSPGVCPDGRSGNHRPEGFYLFFDPKHAGVRLCKDGHIQDLAPTIFQIMSLPPPEHMQGRPLFDLEAK